MNISIYNHVIDNITERHIRERKLRSDEISRMETIFNDRLRKITEATNEFMFTGLARLDKYYGGYYGVTMPDGRYHKRFHWGAYFRQLAKDNNRPYVRVENYYYFLPSNTYVPMRRRPTVLVPKRKYLAPVMAQLLFAANAQDNENRIITKVEMSAQYAFIFSPCDAGQNFFDTWEHTIRTDPDCRRALRVTL